MSAGPLRLAWSQSQAQSLSPPATGLRPTQSQAQVYETGLAHPATQLRSLVAETSFRPSPTSNSPQPSLPSPGPGASQGMPATSPAHQQAQPGVPRSGLSSVSKLLSLSSPPQSGCPSSSARLARPPAGPAQSGLSNV